MARILIGVAIGIPLGFLLTLLLEVFLMKTVFPPEEKPADTRYWVR